MMMTGILLIPLGFLKSLQMVSMLSFWCTMSHLVINAIILGYCLLELPDWGWGKSFIFFKSNFSAPFIIQLLIGVMKWS